MVDDPQAIADACARALYERDRASKALGMVVEDIGPGRARLSMIVRDDMTNGVGIGHGGLLFTLGDSAFAYACNTYDRRTVAQGCSIDFLAPVQAGDRITAEATEQSRSGRTGVYDVRLTNSQGRLVALFRGRSYEIRGGVLEP